MGHNAGTILENARGGTSLFVDFAERIAKPLQMEDFALRYCRYQRGGDSIHPAYIFRMSARDLARFGLLYLRRGAWNGRQIVPADWVAESLVSYSNAGRGGYGYMWWVSRQGRLIGNLELPGEHFAAQGNKGQIIFVYPQLDLVVVHRVDSRIPGKEIPNSQIGELLRRIIAARAS
ncbi:serine hydrolase [bacterium]|nr:serine hydrolase [bacterium]